MKKERVTDKLNWKKDLMKIARQENIFLYERQWQIIGFIAEDSKGIVVNSLVNLCGHKLRLIIEKDLKRRLRE